MSKNKNQEPSFITRLFGNILATNTFKQSGITLLGTSVTGFLGILFYILLARFLGPESFGIVSVSIATLTLVSSMADVGTNTGIVRFAAKYFVSDPERAHKYLKLSLEVKLIAWIVVLALGWILVPYLASSFLGKTELIFPFRIALVGVGGSLLFTFVTYSLQSLQKYWSWSGINILMNFLRLLVLVFVYYLSKLTIENGIYIYIAFPFLGFFVGLFLIPKFWNAKNEWEYSGDLFKYNKWVAAFTLLSALSARLDTFLNTRFLSLQEVGVYQVAKNLTDIVPQIVFALAVVVAPKLAAFNMDHKKAVPYLKKVQLLTLGLSVIGIFVGIPLGYLLIPQIYGMEYLSSIYPFIILIIAQAVFLISIPAHTSVIYYFSNPKLFLPISLGHLSVVGVLGWTIIPRYGYIGAAWVVLLGSLFNFVVPAIWVYKKFKE